MTARLLAANVRLLTYVVVIFMAKYEHTTAKTTSAYNTLAEA
jgi:hypothetical protein